MVVDPHNPDDGEADDVRGQRGPLRAKLVGQVLVGAGLGDRQDQQRDRNGEYSVAERLDPGLVHPERPLYRSAPSGRVVKTLPWGSMPPAHRADPDVGLSVGDELGEPPPPS